MSSLWGYRKPVIFALRLENTSSMQSRHSEYLIIGAGPAGIQLGYYLQKNGKDYRIIEATDDVASFFTEFPRSRSLISFNKVNNIYDDPELLLRWDWNSLLTDDYSLLFTDYSKNMYPESDELKTYLQDFSKKYELKILFNTKIGEISRNSDATFMLTSTSGNKFSCKHLIIATGFSNEYAPDITGIELVKETYKTVSFNGEDFTNQRVLIIGKGNSAYEVADNLLDHASLIHLASPNTTKLAWNTRHPGHVRSNYTNILDTYQLKLLHGVLDCDIMDISYKDGAYVVRVVYAHADNEEEEIIYDRVIRCTGFQFDDSIYHETCTPELVINDRFPAITSSYESQNVPNMHFAGTLMQSRDFKKAGSAFIDGFRYNIRALYHLLCLKNHDEELPSIHLPINVESLSELVQHRVCRTSALWAQFGYLCDVIDIDIESQNIRYHEELPVDYVLSDSEFKNRPHVYTITFEWGRWTGDVFAIERHPSHDTAYTNAFLHPIIRRYENGTLLAEHHILEDLFGMYSNKSAAKAYQSRSGRSMADYHSQEHDKPLREFFETQIGPYVTHH